MRYNRGHVKNHLSNKKHIAIYALCLLLIASVFFYSNAITGYVTYSESLQKEVNDTKTGLVLCKTDLSNSESVFSSCKSDLSTAQSDLQATQSNLDICTGRINTLNSNVVECTKEKESLKQQFQSAQQNYQSIATNSAKVICCRPGLASTNWDISNNSIVCTGSQLLNCTG